MWNQKFMTAIWMAWQNSRKRNSISTTTIIIIINRGNVTFIVFTVLREILNQRTNDISIRLFIHSVCVSFEIPNVWFVYIQQKNDEFWLKKRKNKQTRLELDWDMFDSANKEYTASKQRWLWTLRRIWNTERCQSLRARKIWAKLRHVNIQKRYQHQ